MKPNPLIHLLNVQSTLKKARECPKQFEKVINKRKGRPRTVGPLQMIKRMATHESYRNQRHVFGAISRQKSLTNSKTPKIYTDNLKQQQLSKPAFLQETSTKWYTQDHHQRNLKVIKDVQQKKQVDRVTRIDLKLLDLKARKMNANDPLGNPVFIMRKNKDELAKYSLNEFAKQVARKQVEVKRGK